MAEMLEQFNFEESARTNPNNYPWPQWTNGSIYKAIQNVDFKASPKTFAYTLLKRAKKLKMCVNRHVGDNYVVFQFFKRDGSGSLIVATNNEETRTNKLTSYNFETGHGSKYPWELWTNGKIYKVQRGTDFAVNPEAFMSSLRNAAKRFKLLVRKEVYGENGVIFQFYENKVSEEDKLFNAAFSRQIEENNN